MKRDCGQALIEQLIADGVPRSATVHDVLCHRIPNCVERRRGAIDIAFEQLEGNDPIVNEIRRCAVGLTQPRLRGTAADAPNDKTARLSFRDCQLALARPQNSTL